MPNNLTYENLIYSPDNKALRHVSPRHQPGPSPGVHELRAVGDVASQATRTHPAACEDLCNDDVERHAVYARTLCYAQGKHLEPL